MNKKEEYIKRINKYFKNKKVRNKFLEQLELFYKIKESKLSLPKYEIGTDITLNKYHLLHGTRVKVNELNKIKETGLIAVEFYDKEYENQKKPYTSEFWTIKEEISIKDYLDKYTGGTLIFKRKESNIEFIDNIDNIPKIIKDMQEPYANWEVYQTKEARFLPTNRNVTCAFILNTNNESIKMLNNSIQSNKLDEIIKKEISPKWFYKKYVENGFHNYDVFETTREIAILFGLPSNLIEGIIVNKEIENNESELNKIKEIFSNCYICNIEGKVIK